jgi:hypothetical protein
LLLRLVPLYRFFKKNGEKKNENENGKKKKAELCAPDENAKILENVRAQ